MTRNRYLLTGFDNLHQAGHRNSKLHGGLRQERFVLLSGSKAIHTLIGPASHRNVRYPPNEKKLAALLCLEEMTIQVYSIFVRHGFRQHGGDNWKGFPNLRYNTYVIAYSYDMSYTVSFPSGRSFSVIKTPVIDSSG